MSDPNSIPQRIIALQSLFMSYRTYRDLKDQFRTLLEQRRAQITAGITDGVRSIVLTGASGSGKTRAMRHMIATQPDLVLDDPETVRRDIVSLSVPTPATLKFVGQTTLAALGFPLRRDRTSQIIWEMVKDHLAARKTLFLHYDEAQDLSLHQTPRELTSVVNTLKSLTQHPTWPINLILTGTSDLATIINHDDQLARRMCPFEFPRLNSAQDTGRILKLLRYYADHAGLPLADTVLTPDLAARLIHAADYEFGLVAEMIIAAFQEAMIAEADNLDIIHFTRMFRARSNCIDGFNPFIADDFERIDSRHLFIGKDKPRDMP